MEKTALLSPIIYAIFYNNIYFTTNIIYSYMAAS